MRVTRMGIILSWKSCEAILLKHEKKKVELDMGMVGVINCVFCIITYIRLLCAKEIKPCPSALGHLLINVFFV